MQTVTMIPGLSTVADRYDAVICDVWGVLHNGVTGYRDAAEALRRFRRDGSRPVVLLTNAPRPSFAVERQLAALGIDREAYDCIVTSGDVTHTLLKREGAKPALHVGPPRDLPLFEGLPLRLTGEAEAELVVCTGLYDDTVEGPDDYRALFGRTIERGLPMTCANPDVVVERGDQLIYCAGALAQLYGEMGGAVVVVGKPHKPVYDVALETLDELAERPLARSRVLAIGDAFPTDVRGDHQDVQALSPSPADFGPADAPDPALVAKRLAIEGLSVVAALPRLAW
jgi:HAD superfamily hydrolase (TIGR01459 family)